MINGHFIFDISFSGMLGTRPIIVPQGQPRQRDGLSQKEQEETTSEIQGTCPSKQQQGGQQAIHPQSLPVVNLSFFGFSVSLSQTNEFSQRFK